MEGYLIIALKSIAVYVFIVAAIRVFGKKEFAQLSVVDVVFILLISNSVQNAMVGSDSSLIGGLVAAFALFLMNFLLKKFTQNNSALKALVEGEPILLVYEGRLNQEGLVKAQISMDELNAAIREHGVDDISHVNLSILETDGNISVLSDNYKKSSKRSHKGHRIIGENNR
ncbi:DUF421 domain-containing protein [Aquirufa sp. ROCK2-A2]